ncbi:hypothetical protein BDZ89DRAFT_1251062 [Hymenopellis radicata]|nr:hypothetical protein BDZ89DRAFT_1251062 [Hymenopellis radicata]
MDVSLNGDCLSAYIDMRCRCLDGLSDVSSSRYGGAIVDTTIGHDSALGSTGLGGERRHGFVLEWCDDLHALCLEVPVQSLGAASAPVFIRTISAPKLCIHGLTGTASTARYLSGLGAMSIGAAGSQRAGYRSTLLFEVWAAQLPPSFTLWRDFIKTEGLLVSSSEYHDPSLPMLAQRHFGAKRVVMSGRLWSPLSHARGVVVIFGDNLYAVVTTLHESRSGDWRELSWGFSVRVLDHITPLFVTRGVDISVVDGSNILLWSISFNMPDLKTCFLGMFNSDNGSDSWLKDCVSTFTRGTNNTVFDLTLLALTHDAGLVHPWDVNDDSDDGFDNYLEGRNVYSRAINTLRHDLLRYYHLLFIDVLLPDSSCISSSTASFGPLVAWLDDFRLYSSSSLLAYWYLNREPFPLGGKQSSFRHTSTPSTDWTIRYLTRCDAPGHLLARLPEGSSGLRRWLALLATPFWCGVLTRESDKESNVLLIRRFSESLCQDGSYEPDCVFTRCVFFSRVSIGWFCGFRVYFIVGY